METVETNYLLGIDIGTSATKGVLTALDGKVLRTETESHSVEMPKPGWFEHDPEKIWWNDVVSLIHKLISTTGVNPKNIVSVGISGLGQDLLPIDSSGKPVRKKAILYGIDTRAINEINELNTDLGKENILQQTANALSTQAIGPKLLWLKKNEPEIFAKAACFVTASTFIVGKLTGKFFLDHHQASFWVPLYDFNHYCWHKEFCRGLVDIDQLPQLLWPTDVAGKVTTEAATVTGLCAGTPVIVGSSDAFAELVSVGATATNKLMVMYGSTTCMFMQLSTPVIEEGLWSYHAYEKGLEGVAMCTATSGVVSQWFRDNFAQDLVSKENITGENAYSQLIREAQEVPAGSDGIVVLPYFSGERSPIFDPQAKGVVFGLQLSHTRGHLFKSILEGTGYSIRHNLEILGNNGVFPIELIAAGGGIKNKIWLQAVTDICQKPQKVPNIEIGAAYGDAFMAGVGIGTHSMNNINSWVSYPETFSPNSGNRGIYDKAYKIYRELYLRNADLMH